MTNYSIDKAFRPLLPDGIETCIFYSGHRHRDEVSDIDNVKVIESGCAVGMDSFAISKRLAGNAEQTVSARTGTK